MANNIPGVIVPVFLLAQQAPPPFYLPRRPEMGPLDSTIWSCNHVSVKHITLDSLYSLSLNKDSVKPQSTRNWYYRLPLAAILKCLLLLRCNGHVVLRMVIYNNKHCITNFIYIYKTVSCFCLFVQAPFKTVYKVL